MFLTVVVLLTVAVTELFEPLPIDPPVAMFPPVVLVTVVELVVPLVETLPLLPLPLAAAVLEAAVEDAAVVPLGEGLAGAGEPPPALLVDGDVAVAPVLPVWPVPDAEPLVPLAWPVLADEVVLVVVDEALVLVGRVPLLPFPPPPLGPPAMDPPVAVPVLAVVVLATATLVPLTNSARQTEPAAAVRFPHTPWCFRLLRSIRQNSSPPERRAEPRFPEFTRLKLLVGQTPNNGGLRKLWSA